MSIDVLFQDPRWEDKGLADVATSAFDATLSHVGLNSENWEVALLACSDAQIAELNAQFRDKAFPTNVLSWPSEERGADIEGQIPANPTEGPELGDIALAYETCVREAEESGTPLGDHASHLIIHGILHLLGYDHERDGDGDLMESTEIAILAMLGVQNPYSGQAAPNLK